MKSTTIMLLWVGCSVRARHLCADARFCDPNGKVWNQVARTDDPAVR